MALVPGDYTFEVYDQRGDGMGSIYPENAGFFELSTDAGGTPEVLVPLTLGYFEFVFTANFTVPKIKAGDFPTHSPASGFSSYESPHGRKTSIPSLVSSDISSDAPSYLPPLLPAPSRVVEPVSPSLPIQGDEGLDDAPAVTSNAADASFIAGGRMIHSWIAALFSLISLL